MIRTRRDQKIADQSETELFSGAFWSGKQATLMGLADGMADMRSDLQKRFGKEVVCVKVSKREGWLKRKLSLQAIMKTAIDQLLSRIEERAVWGKFGL